MNERQQQIDLLLQKLATLTSRQQDLTREINQLRGEIDYLVQETKLEENAISPVVPEGQPKPMIDTFTHAQEPIKTSTTNKFKPEHTKPLSKTDLEKFIGENLINKIGIAITVIGVGIGAKYSIEHGLISPITRIILGYLSGLILLGFGFKLKSKFENYSAVLVAGAMAIMYFISFIGYDFYELMPVSVAFGLMVVFTIFTVIAALSYNNQVIALIGLVGAYAVPFLLSSGSGDVKVLFSYVAIINIGILVTAFRQYWKLLYYLSFFFTWIIYSFWYFDSFSVNEHFTLALLFAAIFFLTFYVIFLAYKLAKKESYHITDAVLLLGNSFVFYAFGYAILDRHVIGEQLLGVFTLANAVLHFAVGAVVFKKHLAERSLLYLVAGLVLVFITIAIPVQLDGRWVTLLWVAEAALVFWIGRTKGIPVYEKMSYPLMVLAFISLVQDWDFAYGNARYVATEQISIFFNVYFLSSILFVACFGFIAYLAHQPKYQPARLSSWLSKAIKYGIPAIAIFALYYGIRLEVANYWYQKYALSGINVRDTDSEYMNLIQHYALLDFKTIWVINYSMLFFTVFTFVNIYRVRDRTFGLVNLLLNTIVLGVFLVLGLYVISDLREAYLSQFQGEYFEVGRYFVAIRYISFVFVAGLVIVSFMLIRQDFMKKGFNKFFFICLHISLVWLLSSELIHWLDMAGSEQSYKLGLSILWGCYSLFLIGLGIWKKQKYLRIGAIILFAGTLIKLFFYDITDMESIAKTIVFVALGVLLLIISFLYNKYKNIIADEDTV